jgi:hypothetical protein
MALTRSSELLVGLQDCLLTQVDAAEVDSVRDAASRAGGGLVLVGQDANAKAAELADTGIALPMLVDRRRYAGKRRVPGTANFQAQWIWAQQHLGLPAILTDSGYIGANDGEALDSVLAQTTRLGPGAVATLPLHSS